jgi:DNA-binding SARP family transcriptional activator
LDLLQFHLLGKFLMFQFNLFDGFRVTNNQSIAATTLGRKSECLLCFLALAQGMNSTREKAAGLIWSDRSDDQARASLRQELSQLRRVLGQDVIEANKQSIRLVPEFVSIDVREFRAAIRKDTPEHLKTAGAL